MDNTQNIDFKIDASGQWYHDGEVINRKALSKLFSDRALVVDEYGKYWLQTPFEKYPVSVEDVPYVIVDCQIIGVEVEFTTNMDELVLRRLGDKIEISNYKGAQVPYIEVRNNLYARIGRSVFYNLIEEFDVDIIEDSTAEDYMVFKKRK